MKRLSIIIVTYNSEKHIYDCLESIYKYNDIGEALEVIIVDNCSQEFLKMQNKINNLYGHRIKILLNNSNGGYGQGNNIGINESSSPVTLIMNPDVRLIMPIFSHVLSVFECKKDISLYGIKQLNASGNPAKSLGCITRTCPYFAEPLRYILSKLDIYCERFMYFNGSCFFINKSYFEEVGLFDENIFMYNEEEDIHFRLRKYKKGRFMYDPTLCCQHLHPSITNYDDDYFYFEKSLESLLYMDKRDGINPRVTIQRCIQRTNLSIIRSLFDSKRKQYYMQWRTILKQYFEAL